MKITIRNGKVVKAELGAATRSKSPTREEVLGSLYDFQLRAIAVTHDQIEQAAKSFGEADSLLSSWVPMLKAEGLIEQRADGNYDFTRSGIEIGATGWRFLQRKKKLHQNKIKRSENQIDKEVKRAWYRNASGVQVPILDIPKIFRDIKLEVAAGVDIDTATRAAIDRYQVGGVTPNLSDNIEIKSVLGGGFMILIDGIQWGEDRDRSGAGRRVFDTWADAYRVATEISRGS